MTTKVLEEYGNEVIQQNEDPDTDEDLPPVFDPVTGRYVSTSKPLRQINHLMVTSSEQGGVDDHDNQLVKRFSNAVAIKGTVSTSAIHLQNRHWTGLEAITLRTRMQLEHWLKTGEKV